MHDLKAVLREQTAELRRLGVHPADAARVLEPLRACADGRHDYRNGDHYGYEHIRKSAPKHASSHHRTAMTQYKSPRRTTRTGGQRRVYD